MRDIDPELPWGVWLRIVDGDRFVDDETGEEWPTLRAALWNRLRMPPLKGERPSEMLETVHAALAVIARRRPGNHEATDDLFDHSDQFMRLFNYWLAGNELIVLNESGNSPAGMTAEGWAVLHMLAATRPHSVRQHRPSAATVRMLTELGLGPEKRDERLVRLEKAAAKWDVAFLRRREAGKPAIILSTRGDGPVPTLQTVWTMRFETVAQRDRFYDWLCLRVDRWPEWVRTASRYGAWDLTHKLLEVMAASLADDEQSRPPPLP